VNVAASGGVPETAIFSLESWYRELPAAGRSFLLSIAVLALAALAAERAALYRAYHCFSIVVRESSSREGKMQLTPREFDKLLIYMMADVALKRKAKGLKLNYPEAVAIISAAALDGARAGKTIEDVTKDASTALTKTDVMDGVADLIPVVQIEAVFTDGSRLVTVHTPIQ
jgi:urease subunit gamma